jgi:protein disulfide-isomerase A6
MWSLWTLWMPAAAVFLTAGARGAEVEILTDANFGSRVEGDSDTPFLVDFYAPWCGHCKRLEPELEDAAKTLDGKMRIGKLDATIHKRTARKYQVEGYPTLKFKRKGHELEDYEGPRTKEAIAAFAERILGERDCCSDD